MAINTTGLYDTEELELGRGIIYIADKDATTGAAQTYRDVGNATEFNLTVAVEDLDHKSSRTALSNIDLRVDISKEISGSFVLDSISFQNLALLFSGTSVQTTTLNVGTEAIFDLFSVGAWSLGVWVDLTRADGSRIYSVVGANIAVNSAATVLVEGTDYDLDEEFGRIFIKSTSIAALPATEALRLTLNASWNSDPDYQVVKGLNKATEAITFKFIAENAVNTNKTEWQFFKAKVRSNGDFALIGDAFSTMPFEFTLEEDANQPADNKFFQALSTAN